MAQFNVNLVGDFEADSSAIARSRNFLNELLAAGKLLGCEDEVTALVNTAKEVTFDKVEFFKELSHLAAKYGFADRLKQAWKHLDMGHYQDFFESSKAEALTDQLPEPFQPRREGKL